ncbi:anaphase promoting complex subunit 11 PWA37_003732 [Arxiozyma heterogenica]|uniref:anaphase promoting complex subunit 11 n=1 Tax=Arxiozyma heterogenica TaxID=278026 RepID=UPI002F206F9C
MKVKVDAVTPVFAWSWDTRNELEIKNDIEKKVYPNIINYNKQKQPEHPLTTINKSQDFLNDSNSNSQQSNVSNVDDIYDDEESDDEDENDVCGICRANYNGTCPTCKIPGDSCPLVIGDCKHFFHYHCIVRWLRTLHSKGLCPMCRRQFLLKKNYPINNPVRKQFNAMMVQLVAQRVEDDEDIGHWVGNQYEIPDYVPDNNLDAILQDGGSVKEYVNFYPIIRPLPWANRDDSTTSYDNSSDSDIDIDDEDGNDKGQDKINSGNDFAKHDNEEKDLFEIVKKSLLDKKDECGEIDNEDLELGAKILQLYKEEADRKKNKVYKKNGYNSIEISDSGEYRYRFDNEDEIYSDMSYESEHVE